MTTVAIAGFGYNGGQVIFKRQEGDLTGTVYKEVAENCECCCLPPPSVKISLYPGPTEIFVAGQADGYNTNLPADLEETLSLKFEDVPCPIRSKWEYTKSYVPEGGIYPVTIILKVPRCIDYPRDLKLAAGTGTEDDILNLRPDRIPPWPRIPVRGNRSPQIYIDFLRFNAFDDSDGNTGLPDPGLCIENVCDGTRTFKVPCFKYPEIGESGYVSNGTTFPGYPNYFQWNFFCGSDVPPNFAHFLVEFPVKQPLP
jgi:hypothetical protein